MSLRRWKNLGMNSTVNSGEGELTQDNKIIEKKIIDENPDWENLSDENLAVLEKYDYLRITPTTDIPKPVPIITISGETISTEGNITTFSGASKSGKSALASWIIASAISADGILNDPLPGLRVEPNPTGKAVIHFDTEQAKHKHQYNVKTILHRANVTENPEYFRSYNIRQLEISDYAKVTSDICEAASKVFNGIHLIVIDGIADYIKDVNDQEQSNSIVKYFEDIAIKYATPVIVIVHTNPNSEKERGHLGSQCQRKSESVLMIKQDGDISYIEPKLLRMAGMGKIQKLQFRYDETKGYHVGCGVRLIDENRAEEERINRIEVIANNVFAPPAEYHYKDAIEKIMKETMKGETAAKGYFTEMKAHDMIVQDHNKIWRLKQDEEV